MSVLYCLYQIIYRIALKFWIFRPWELERENTKFSYLKSTKCEPLLYVKTYTWYMVET
jgi:hypothetical protein